MANNTKIGTGQTNLVLETAGRVYVKVADRFYELNFRDKGVKELVKSEGSEVNPEDINIDLSKYVTVDNLEEILEDYVKTRDFLDLEDLVALLSKEVAQLKILIEEFEGSGDSYFKWDAANQAVYTDFPLYSMEWISSGGIGEGDDEDGSAITVYGWDALQNGVKDENGDSVTLLEESEIDTFNAYSIRELYNLVKDGTLNEDKLWDILDKNNDGKIDKNLLETPYLTFLCAENDDDFKSLFTEDTTTKDWEGSQFNFELGQAISRETLQKALNVTKLLEWFKWDPEAVYEVDGVSTKGAIHTNFPFYSDYWISAGGKSEDSNGGGLIESVLDIDSLGGSFDKTDRTETFNAHAINSIYLDLQKLKEEGTLNEDKLWDILSKNDPDRTINIGLLPGDGIMKFFTSSDKWTPEEVDPSSEHPHKHQYTLTEISLALGEGLSTETMQKALDVYKFIDWFRYDNNEKAIHCILPFYSDSWVSAGGKDPDGDSGLLTVIQSWDDSTASVSDALGFGLGLGLKNDFESFKTEVNEKLLKAGDQVTVTTKTFEGEVTEIATIQVVSSETSRNKTYTLNVPETANVDKLKEDLKAYFVPYDEGTQNVSAIKVLKVQDDIIGMTASDFSLKDNITPISTEDSLKVILGLEPVSFTWNETMMELNPYKVGESQGFIAQDYMKLIPNSGGKIYKDYWGIDYLRTLPYLVKVTQDHEERITLLERRL